MVLNLNEQQRDYVVAALKFAQWALLEDDDLSDNIHQAVYDYYEAQNIANHGANNFQWAVAFTEDMATVNAIFDTFDTGDNMGARCDIGAIIEQIENQ